MKKIEKKEPIKDIKLISIKERLLKLIKYPLIIAERKYPLPK